MWDEWDESNESDESRGLGSDCRRILCVSECDSSRLCCALHIKRLIISSGLSSLS